MALAASLFSGSVTFCARGIPLLCAAPVHTNVQLPQERAVGPPNGQFSISRARPTSARRRNLTQSRDHDWRGRLVANARSRCTLRAIGAAARRSVRRRRQCLGNCWGHRKRTRQRPPTGGVRDDTFHVGLDRLRAGCVPADRPNRQDTMVARKSF